MSSTNSSGQVFWLAMNCSTSTRFKATISERVALFSRRHKVGLLPSSSLLPTAVCISGSLRKAA